MKKKAVAVSVAIAITFASGCSTKQQTGTAIGAGIGGITCGLLASGSGTAVRLFATMGCAAVGGLIGNKIGSMLDERDRNTLAEQKAKVLASANPGAKASWKSEHSGAVATVETTKQFTRVKQVAVKRTQAVEPPGADMQLMQAQYVTMKSANVRSAPRTGAEKVGGMLSGTEFTAIGKTGDWILVGRKGVNVGYVHDSLVDSKESLEAHKKESVAKVKLDDVDVSKRETKGFAVTQAEVSSNSSKPADAYEIDSNAELNSVKPAAEIADSVVTENVVAKATCKEVQTKVSVAGKTETSKDTYCQSGSGFEDFSI